ncbi:alcohol dehydrogenase catalytic domain-containing protein [Streptosporangium lutulentum]|uniref:S-(Hydroxymethyl)glutathione dehydrogenase/alcohol dehydrogenase n=1 Tax=Streptosporangium lutulentum TaxID=1461250 RepID=A0ABT9QSH2_9ACTN|nr:alcohol dehydrogenase catalytic domain-containing protein [Streptosporangium lutulentum]MDP9849658.1 S-(hydroxymethyl)glutathione dehydrogenase/alcohol dehydrogenase [Streptosporangium lutulentum]
MTDQSINPAAAVGYPGNQSGEFKGWVRYQDWFEIRDLRLRPRRPTDVVIRNLAAQACYTLVPNVADLSTTHHDKARSPGHGAMGVVVEVGSQVRRVKVGDRVVTPVLPSCGTCYSCVRGEWHACGHKNDLDFATQEAPPFAELEDGTPVWQDHTGGFAELAVCDESWVVPVFDSPLSDVELASLACVPGPGWSFALFGMPVEIASKVAVLGAGALGLSIIQAAKMMGAQLIIAVERIPHRMEAAKRAGAHIVLDADEYGAGIVKKIQELCGPDTPNMAAGGKPSEGFYHGRGADHIYEAAGKTIGDPTTGKPADVSGSAALGYGYQATRRGGTFVHTGWIERTNDPQWWPASPGPFDYEGKKYLSASYGGANVLRDIPRLAKLIEMGYLDAKSLCDPVMPFEKGDQALWHSLNRDSLLPIITYDE